MHARCRLLSSLPQQRPLQTKRNAPLTHTKRAHPPANNTHTHASTQTVVNGVVFRQLFDGSSSTYTYLLADPASGEAVLIDPVLEQVRVWR